MQRASEYRNAAIIVCTGLAVAAIYTYRSRAAALIIGTQATVISYIHTPYLQSFSPSIFSYMCVADASSRSAIRIDVIDASRSNATQATCADNSNVILLGTNSLPQTTLEMLQQQLADCIIQLGPSHPDIAISSHAVGEAFAAIGQPLPSLLHHERALDCRVRIFGVQHAVVAESHCKVGMAWLQIHEFKQVNHLLRSIIRFSVDHLICLINTDIWSLTNILS